MTDTETCRATFPSTDIRCEKYAFHADQGRGVCHEATINGMTVEWQVTAWPTLAEATNG